HSPLIGSQTFGDQSDCSRVAQVDARGARVGRTNLPKLTRSGVPRMLQRILVPLDGSGLAERALTYATAIAESTGAEMLLLRAVSSRTLPGVDPRERQQGAID